MENKKFYNRVNLLAKSVPTDGSKNVEKVVAASIKFEYTNDNILRLYKNLDNYKTKNIIDTINRSGETNYLEHINFTFGIENLSKECAAEILNYSLASSTRNNGNIKFYENKLLVTMNAEDLLDFFEDKCCNLAGAEINDVADKMLDICLQEAPTIFANSGAPCTFKKCDKKDKTCNKSKRAKVKQIIKTY